MYVISQTYREAFGCTRIGEQCAIVVVSELRSVKDCELLLATFD